MGASKKLAASKAAKAATTADITKVLQRVHAVAEEVGIIVLGHIPDEDQAEVTERLLTFLRTLDSEGGSNLDKMIVIGALAGIGHVDYGTNEI